MTRGGSTDNVAGVVSKPIKREKPEACKWSSKEVLEWMEKKEISPYLINKLKKDMCDGELLFHLFNDYIKKENIFLQILNESNNNLNLFDLVRFTFELQKLFETAVEL